MCNYLNCNENLNLNDEDILSSPKLNARDSILRARSKALRSSELQHLEQILPLKSDNKTGYNFTIVSAIEEALESEKNRKDGKMITDYEAKKRRQGKIWSSKV